MFKPDFGLKFLQFLLGAFCLFLTFSCASDVDEFAGQRRQFRNNNPVNITQEDPMNYYYQDPAARSGMYTGQYGRQAPAQPYYYQQQVVPAYAPGSYQVPASRFYSNPYAIPPSNRYQRYDADQYYVPPSRYRNIESQQPNVNDHYDSGSDVKG